MLLRVGCQFDYETPAPTPSVMLVRPHPDPPHQVVRQSWLAEPALEPHGYHDLFNNRCDRVTLPIGNTSLRYDALVEVSGDPDPVAPDAEQLAVEALPDHLLVFTLSSRYCQVEALSTTAWHLFGNAPLGWGRVQAVCDWIHHNIEYGRIRSTPLTTAVDVYVAGGGMCRDFAHLAVTFCRALNIPARYVFGYMPDIGATPPHRPMDFHAWFEVYLRDRWWTFDARFNVPRIGRIPIGRGRDAVDVAMMTTYGGAMFRRMVVWADEATDETDGTAAAHDEATAEAPDESDALVLQHGD